MLMLKWPFFGPLPLRDMLVGALAHAYNSMLPN
jgi:hypothetical protein